MAKRRGRGEGTISQRADGTWQGRVDLGRGEDGRRRRKVVYGATREAVSTALNKLLGRQADGEPLTTSTPTVRRWLDSWYATHQDEWRPLTQQLYRRAITDWISPALGALRLEKATPAVIQRWITKATADGPHEKIRIAHCVLRSAFKWAMHQRVLTYNPAALCTVPRVIHAAVTPLSAEQSRRLVRVVETHRLGPMILTSLTLGLRIGEASGLCWDDVDLDARTLQVRQQVQVAGKGRLALVDVKTENSRRRLALPALVVSALQAHRVRQLEERLQAGPRWHTSPLVFTTADGRPLHPEHVRRALYALLEAAGLDRLKYHGLRHSAATLLLTDGTPLFDVSRILGHAQIQTTADIYGHLQPEMAAAAATRMDRLLATRKRG
jgi:integrase